MEQHTAVNLANYLDVVLDCWNLPITQVSAVVTDNATNITAAIARLERQRIGCFSHTLQLSVQKALTLPVMSKAIACGKRLVSHFHTSIMIIMKFIFLYRTYVLDGIPLERILQQQQPLCATLIEIRRSDLMPTDAEISNMEGFVEAMRHNRSNGKRKTSFIFSSSTVSV